MERVRFSIRVEKGVAGSKAGCASGLTSLTVEALRAALSAVLPPDLILASLLLLWRSSANGESPVLDDPCFREPHWER
jgi:hypothetical protein